VRKGFTIEETFVFILVAFIVLLFIFGSYQLFCSSHITEGTVVWRKFRPEHLESSTSYVYVGKNHSVPVTSWHTVPDRYTVGLEGEYKGKIYVRSLEVDKVSYKLMRVGQKLRVEDLPLIPMAEEEEEK
jgi:hypothetical protein